MTLAEKARQVSCIMPTLLAGEDGFTKRAMDEHLGLGIGHIATPVGAGGLPKQMAKTANEIQRYLVEHTRLGIPAIIHGESLNGFAAAGYTSFPTAIGLAATWDPDAVEEMTAIIRRQMRSVGCRQALSPVMDVARDARWGRIHETYGEDPYLVSAMSVAFVRGIQGSDLTQGVLATAKHFLAYALTEAGQNLAATYLGSRELYDVYATPFEAAIHLADLASVMNSYSEIDGVPVGASREILTTLLRERMGFQGSVVSDYSTVERLHNRQHVAESAMEAGILAITAGLDVELPKPVGYGENLEIAVRSGRLSEEILDEAVRRALVDKFKLGLFDDPYVDEDPAVLNAVAQEGGALSRSLAEKSITLLKNDGILPLPKTARVAVIGPHADSAMVNFASYTLPAGLTMFQELAAGESRLPSEQVGEGSAETMATRFAQLMAIDLEDLVRGPAYGSSSLAEAVRELTPGVEVASHPGVGLRPEDPQDIAAAVAVARTADVVVLAIGGKAGWFGKHITEGEGTDMARIELPSPQVELIKALADTGVPMVGVMYQGRPYALSEVDHLLRALVVAYYPGPAGAKAVASVLFGDVNPSGKLPYTMPRATGQVPIYYSQKHGSGYRRGVGDTFREYIDLPVTPLYPFGHGLSYTTFEYGELNLSDESVEAEGGQITISLEVRNTGERDGTEVVQLYFSDQATGVTRPFQQLVGFTRADIPAGGQVTVSFTVQMSQLGYSGVDGRFILEPGPIKVAVGSSSDDLRSTGEFQVTGKTLQLDGRRSYLSSSTVSV
jgi:beta-glucosidase